MEKIECKLATTLEKKPNVHVNIATKQVWKEMATEMSKGFLEAFPKLLCQEDARNVR
jgi:hypothetical protein